MHNSPLAFEATAFASVMSMVFGSMILILFRFGIIRTRLVIPIVAGLYMNCLYWAILAITAGPAPLIRRIDTVMYERPLLIATYIVFGVGVFGIFGALIAPVWNPARSQYRMWKS